MRISPRKLFLVATTPPTTRFDGAQGSAPGGLIPGSDPTRSSAQSTAWLWQQTSPPVCGGLFGSPKESEIRERLGRPG
jgi:hypothetical protein